MMLRSWRFERAAPNHIHTCGQGRGKNSSALPNQGEPHTTQLQASVPKPTFIPWAAAFQPTHVQSTFPYSSLLWCWNCCSAPVWDQVKDANLQCPPCTITSPGAAGGYSHFAQSNTDPSNDLLMAVLVQLLWSLKKLILHRTDHPGVSHSGTGSCHPAPHCSSLCHLSGLEKTGIC